MKKNNFLKIGIEKLLIEKTFSREVYLGMPRNGKMLRIVSIGDNIRPDLLQRLSKFSNELFISLFPNDPLDVEKIKIYEDGSISKSSQKINVDESQKFSQENEIAEIALKKGQISSSENPNLVKEDQFANEEEKRKTNESDTAEENQKINSAPTEPPQNKRVSNLPDNLEENRIKTDSDQPDDVNKFSLEPAESESIERISRPNSKAVSKSEFFSKKRSSESEFSHDFQSTISEVEEISELNLEEQMNFVISGTNGLEKKAPQKIENEKIANNVSDVSIKEIEKNMESVPQLFSFKKKKGAEETSAIFEPTPSLSAILVGVSQAIKLATSTPEIEDLVSELNSALEKTKNDPSETNKIHNLEEILSVIQRTSSRMPNKGKNADHQELKRFLEKLSDEIAENFSQKEGIHIQSTSAEKSPSKKEKDSFAFLQLPQVAARMATYLGYSLGYADFNFLSEIGLAAVLKFSKANGVLVETTSLDTFSQKVLQGVRPFADSTLSDTVDIIEFLEAYFKIPECDRRARFPSIETFKSTIETLGTESSNIDNLNITRWLHFIESGPSSTAHSLCSQATARAIKKSKDLGVNLT